MADGFKVADLFDKYGPTYLLDRPQGYYEPDWLYTARRVPSQVAHAAGNEIARDAGIAAAHVFASPALRAAQAPPSVTVPLPAATPATARQNMQAAGSHFPTSYKDPVYDEADKYAAQLTGVPLQLLNSIRLRGERTNAGVISAAGANTPYQITPQTRAGIIKNYGIDPWSNPQNAALGAAYVLREQGGQPKNWDGQVAQKAVMGYFGGAAGRNNPFLADANGQTTGGYARQVLTGDTKLPFPMLDPYNPQMDQAALGVLERGRQAALQPSHFEASLGPAPTVPKPEAVPQTDFSESDAALEAMRPVEMTMKEEHQRQTRGFFRGMAQVALQSSGNEGLGTFLMHLGGGALAGRQQADDEIQREQDKYEDKLAAFHAAVFHNDLGKAEVHAREAQAQVDQTNKYNYANWQVAYDQYSKGTNIDVSGSSAVVKHLDPTTGKLTVDVLPIAGAVNAAFSREIASQLSSMGGREFAGQQQITGAVNAFTMRQAIATMQDPAAGQQEKAGALAAAPAFFGTYIASHNLTADLLGPDGAKSLEQSVQKTLMGQQLVPGSEAWTNAHDRMVAGEIAKLGVADPGMMKKMAQVGAAASSFEALDAARKGRTSTSVDPKTGQATTRETGPSYTGAAADLFDGGSPGYTNQDLAPYGYSRQ